MASHTPGPWNSDDWGKISADDGRAVAFAAGARVDVADVESRNGEASANARLIAAAPDMYRALRVMARHHSASPHIGLARAAIAKAEGR